MKINKSSSAIAYNVIWVWFIDPRNAIDSTDECGSTKSNLVIMQKLKPMAETWLSMDPSISRALPLMVPCSAVCSFSWPQFYSASVQWQNLFSWPTQPLMHCQPSSHPLRWLLFILKWMQCHGNNNMVHLRNLCAFAFRWRKTKDERRCCEFNWRVLFNIWKSLVGR